MTTADILKKLSISGKFVGLTQLYKYLDICGIKPTGVRQRPQQYPADAAQQILSYLGFSAVAANGSVHKQSHNRVTASPRRAAEKILSLKQLKSNRRKK